MGRLSASARPTGDADTDLEDHVATNGASVESWAARAVVSTTLLTWFGSRIWIASNATVPKGPDVIGPWAAAFAIAGADPSIDMGDLPPYSVAMGAVLSPLVVLVEDPTFRYQIAVVLTGILTLIAAWFISRWLKSMATLGPLPTAVAFAVVALIPSVVFTSSFTWAEPLVLLWLATWLLLVAYALSANRLLPLIAVAAYSGTSILVHGRLVLVGPVWMLATIAVTMMAGRPSPISNWRRTIAIGAPITIATVASLLISLRIRGIVVDAAWSQPPTRPETGFIDRLDEQGYWIAALQTAIGQAWYVLTSTAGLAGVGVWALARQARVRGVVAGRDVRSQIALTSAFGLASVALTSVVWLAPTLIGGTPNRLDYLIYGRYVDPAAVVLAAIGGWALVGMETRGTRRALSLSLLALALLAPVVRLIRDSFDAAPVAVNSAVISGVASWPFDRPGLDIARWTLLGGVVGLCLVMSTLVNRTMTVVTLVALLTLGSVTASRHAANEHGAWANPELYAGYPDAGRRSAALVASDALTSLGYRFNWPIQQYALADEGWRFEITDTDSAALATAPPTAAGMLVLKWDATPTGEWCSMPPFQDVKIWLREVGGTPGEPCVTISGP